MKLLSSRSLNDANRFQNHLKQQSCISIQNRPKNFQKYLPTTPTLTILIERSNNLSFNLNIITSVNQQSQVHFRSRHAPGSLDGHLPLGRKKHFFHAEAARSIFSIAQGTAAKGYGDGWDGSLYPQKSSRVFSKCPCIETNCAYLIPNSGHPILNAGMAFPQTLFALVRASRHALPPRPVQPDLAR